MQVLLGLSLCVGVTFRNSNISVPFFWPALLRLHQCVDNWMCMILNDVLMSAYVYLAPSVTHLHIHNKHKHAQSRFMHGTVPGPFKARGSYKVYLVMQGYCALFELHCLN